MNRKLFISLNDDWIAKKTIIVEYKNLKVIPFDEIIRSILTNEVEVAKSKSHLEQQGIEFSLKFTKFYDHNDKITMLS